MPYNNQFPPCTFSDTLPSKEGYIVMDKSFKNWPYFKDADMWQLFCYLLMSANYKTNFFNKSKIERGSFMTSYDHLGIALGKSARAVRYMVEKLRNIREIETRKQDFGLMIKIVHYDSYQSISNGVEAKTFPTRPKNTYKKPKIESYKPQPPESPSFDNQGITPTPARPAENKRKTADLEKIALTQGQTLPTPTRQEFYAFCDTLNAFVPDNVYDIYADNNWHMPSGRKITNWQESIIPYVKMSMRL